MKATSPYLNNRLRSIPEVRGETVVHMPDSESDFLLGPDEVYVEMPRRRWRKRAAIWAVALVFLALGFAFGPHVVLYAQSALQNR